MLKRKGIGKTTFFCLKVVKGKKKIRSGEWGLNTGFRQRVIFQTWLIKDHRKCTAFINIKDPKKFFF